jgi:hypothetical protein
MLMNVTKLTISESALSLSQTCSLKAQRLLKILVSIQQQIFSVVYQNHLDCHWVKLAV